MKEYHKIQTVFKRDPATKFRTLLEWVYAEPAFGFLAYTNWVWTEKVDGTNIRVMCGEAKDYGRTCDVTFGGKTDNAQIPAFLVTALEQRFLGIEQRRKLAEMFPDGACLYGEGYGAKIQKGGGNYRADQDFVLFDVKVGDWWLERSAVEDVAAKLGLDVVPIVGHGSIEDMVKFVRAGFPSQWGDFGAEGVVARPKVELCNRGGHRIITKLKYKDFNSV